MNASASETIKIAMNGEVKAAKDIGTGKGIAFLLPKLDDKEYNINLIELAVFEKRHGENEWKIYLDGNNYESKKMLLTDAESLNIQADFGEASDYRDKAKYKLAYRYHVQSTSDESVIAVAGADKKDGWRLIGESNPTIATSDGFSFYKNSVPILSVESITYTVHTNDGLSTKTCTADNLENTPLPKDAFINGIKINLTASDFDAEDILTARYELRNKLTGDYIAYGALPADNKIISQTSAKNVQLRITVSDNFGASASSEWINITLDSEAPKVINEFDDGGFYLRGRILFSRFTVTDNGHLMTDGSVYASVFHDDKFIRNIQLDNMGEGVYCLDENNMADGLYTVELKAFDKSGNEARHVFTQKLDNTKPTAKFLSPEDDSDATLYSTWMNESKYLVISAFDGGSGVAKYTVNNSRAELTDSLSEIVIKKPVSTTQTGKIKYSGYIYDNARTIEKTANKYKSDSNGNSLSFTKEVWIDKTKPIVNTNIDSTQWESTPKLIFGTFADLPSSPDTDDASGIKERYCSVTDRAMISGEWSEYTMPFNINDGGVFYVHFKAVDNAGNEAVYTHRVMLNSSSEILSGVTPADSSMHTIYYSNGDLHVARNTAYSTKFHFLISDADINDTIAANIKLVNRDNSAVFANAKTKKAPTGEAVRDVEFNMQYLDRERNKLPDGVYDMYVNITEKKTDGVSVNTHTKVLGCSVVIKRNAPPIPVISASSGSVNIEYPEEPLSESLNTAEIRALYKKQYKAVKAGDAGCTYVDYTDSFAAEDMTVTAVYTDIAGNASTAEKRIFGNDNGAADSDITKEGNNVTVEESRIADTYFIGIRRKKQSGISADIFKFME